MNCISTRDSTRSRKEGGREGRPATVTRRVRVDIALFQEGAHIYIVSYGGGHGGGPWSSPSSTAGGHRYVVKASLLLPHAHSQLPTRVAFDQIRCLPGED